MFELSKVKVPLIRERIVGHLRHIDEDLAKRVAAGLNLSPLPDALPAAAKAEDLPPSPALQTTGKWLDTLKGRCVGVGGARLSNRRHQPAHGQLAGLPSVLFDAVVLLLSEEAGAVLAKEAAAVDFVRHAFDHLKAIALSPGGQLVAQAAGIEPDKFVVGADDPKAYVRAASQRAWDREPLGAKSVFDALLN